MRLGKELTKKFEKTGGLHLLLKRKLVPQHEGLEDVFRRLENGERVRVLLNYFPNRLTDMSDLMLWGFAKYLSSMLDSEVLFHVLDDWAYLSRDSLRQEDVKSYSYEALSHFHALGFRGNKTRVILSTRDVKLNYANALSYAKVVSFSEAKSQLGLKNSSNLGEIYAASMLAAPLLEKRDGPGLALIPCFNRDKKLYEVVRKVAPRLNIPSPALLLMKELPSLTGEEKEARVLPEAQIYAGEAPTKARVKLMNAFTGGRATIKEQREHGGNPDICPIYKYLLYFDARDDRVREQYQRCRSGALLCGEHKKYLWSMVKEFLDAHQRKLEKGNPHG